MSMGICSAMVVVVGGGVVVQLLLLLVYTMQVSAPPGPGTFFCIGTQN